MLNKVFIVNKSCHDYSAATKFGNLHYLSIGNLNRFDTVDIYRKFSEVLKIANKHDYILLSGLSIMNSIACAIFAVNHHRLNLLLWSAKKSEYVEKTIVF